MSAERPTSGNDGPRIQLRRDLRWAHYDVAGAPQVVLKDPLKLEYFLFEALEQTLLKLLKRPRTISELESAANHTLAPDHVEKGELLVFVRRLLQDNLVTIEETGHGHSLWQSKRQLGRAQRWRQLLGVLAIRWRGVDPQNILDRLNPFSRFLFHPIFLWLAMGLFALSVVTILLNVERIFETDFLWQNITTPRTWLPIALALFVVKFLHELGHAAACRSIGRDCHEMGVLFLAFIPCLYCNVSDIWMEPNRWKRMLVSAAGIYVEMLVAVVCLPLWLLSEPGPTQVFWFSMLSISSLNTILINGNPLLRYDGYYVLSDFVQIPNLYQSSQQRWTQRLRSLFTDDAEASVPFGWIDIYGLLAPLYRVFVLSVIVAAIYLFFERIALPQFGWIVALTLIAVSLGPGVSNVATSTVRTVWRRSIKWGPLFCGALLAGIVLVLVARLPISDRTYSQGSIGLLGRGMIYAPHDGQIHWLVPVGSPVKADQVLARLSNDDLDYQWKTQCQRVEAYRVALENEQLLLRQGADNTRAIELQMGILKSAEAIEKQLQQQRLSMEIRAAIDGRLVSLPQTPPPANELVRSVDSLREENQGCWVGRGQPIAAIVNAESCVAKLQVAEQQIERVALGQEVKLLVGQSSPEIVTGVVIDIALNTDTANRTQEHQQGEPRGDFVEVIVEFDVPQDRNFLNSPVSAVIVGPPLRAYQYLWRSLVENFRLI